MFSVSRRFAISCVHFVSAANRVPDVGGQRRSRFRRRLSPVHGMYRSGDSRGCGLSRARGEAATWLLWGLEVADDRTGDRAGNRMRVVGRRSVPSPARTSSGPAYVPSTTTRWRSSSYSEPSHQNIVRGLDAPLLSQTSDAIDGTRTLAWELNRRHDVPCERARCENRCRDMCCFVNSVTTTKCRMADV